MTVPNAFFIFLMAFSGITGWLILREPATISMTDAAVIPDKKPELEKAKTEKPSTPTIPDKQDPIRSQLADITLPVLDLNNATLSEAIYFLQLRAAELSSDATAAQSLHFRFSNEESEILHQSITLYAEDITLADALNLICEKAQCHWEIEDHQVLIITE